MKQTTETNQVSFEKGMIENVKQESFGESLGSCLLLDNYNHTIEIGSVLKRTGEGTYLPTFMQADEYNGNLLARYKDNPAHALSDVVHSLVMNTANPKINDTFVLILENKNYPDVRCRVIGLVPYNHPTINPNEKETGLANWRNTHNEADGVMANYRGWDIKGLYRCSAIYGESLAIGTQPDKLIVADPTNYFPLYIWKLMDLSKKREKGANFFFNGISVNDLNNYSQVRVFNVKTPKQAMRNNTFCKVRGFNGYTGQWYNNNEPEGDLTVIVTEEELRYNSFYSFDRWKTNDKSVYNYSNFCYPNPQVNRWYQKGVKVVKSFEVPTFPFAANVEEDIHKHIPIDNGITGPGQTLKATRRTLKTTARDIEVLMLKLNNTYLARECCDGQDKMNNFGLWKVKGFEQFKQFSNKTDNFVERVVTFAMPDYISNNEPRCWTKGEKIPLVVTANFGGHEVILSKLEYIVQGGEMAYPEGAAFNVYRASVQSPVALALKHFYIDGDEAHWILPYCHETVHPIIRDDLYIVPRGPSVEYNFYHYHSNLSNTYTSDFGVRTAWYRNGPVGSYGRLPKIKDYLPMDDESIDVSDAERSFEHTEVCPKNYNTLRISIKLKKAMFDWCIQNECTSIKVYIAKGDMGQKSHLKSIGVMSYQEPPVGLYHKPMSGSYDTQKTDYSMYGLLKEFIIEGEGDIPRQYEDKETFAISTLLRTNAWQQIGDEYWAVPISDSESGISPNPMPIEGVLINSKLNPPPNKPMAVENSFIKYKFDEWDDKSLNEYRAYDKNQVTVNLLADKRWTPDFYIQDYAYNAPTLELNTDGEYWDGLGCDVVSIIKGRAFIANNREQAIVRYSAAQNGVILQDLFNKEDKITVGHETVTAMVEFREQLCVFNETSFYRITLPNIFDESTWEFLEAVKGQGTMSPKTICVTPYGFAFLNRNGIWFSQGGESQNIGAVIQALYLHLSTGIPYAFSHLYDPGTPNIDKDTLFNNEMEIDYDSAKDEIVVSCSVFGEDKSNKEIRLIYNFKTQSWRIESFNFNGWVNQMYELSYNGKLNISNPYREYPSFTEGTLPTLFVDRGKTHFDHNGIMVTRTLYDRILSQAMFEHGKQSLNNYLDLWYGWMPVFINSHLITHEIGDGQNDFILHKVLLDAFARDRLKQVVSREKNVILLIHNIFGYRDYTYSFDTASQFHDPIVDTELRNQGYITSNTNSRIVDLVPPNMQGKITRSQNLFISPNNTPFGNTGIEINSSSEAVTLLSSLNAKFRRMRIHVQSEVIAKIYGIQAQAKAAIRRFQ